MALLTKGVVNTRRLHMQIRLAVSHGTDDPMLAAADIAADPASLLVPALKHQSEPGASTTLRAGRAPL